MEERKKRRTNIVSGTKRMVWSYIFKVSDEMRQNERNFAYEITHL